MVVLTRDRYIVFQAIVESTVPNLTVLKTTIWKKYETIFGLSGTSEAGLYFETFDEKNGTGLIRCSSRSLSSLLTVFALITKIEEDDVILLPLFISGLIKKAKAYLSNI